MAAAARGRSDPRRARGAARAARRRGRRLHRHRGGRGTGGPAHVEPRRVALSAPEQRPTDLQAAALPLECCRVAARARPRRDHVTEPAPHLRGVRTRDRLRDDASRTRAARRRRRAPRGPGARRLGPVRRRGAFWSRRHGAHLLRDRRTRGLRRLARRSRAQRSRGPPGSAGRRSPRRRLALSPGAGDGRRRPHQGAGRGARSRSCDRRLPAVREASSRVARDVAPGAAPERCARRQRLLRGLLVVGPIRVPPAPGRVGESPPLLRRPRQDEVLVLHRTDPVELGADQPPRAVDGAARPARTDPGAWRRTGRAGATAGRPAVSRRVLGRDGRLLFDGRLQAPRLPVAVVAPRRRAARGLGGLSRSALARPRRPARVRRALRGARPREPVPAAVERAPRVSRPLAATGRGRPARDARTGRIPHAARPRRGSLRAAALLPGPRGAAARGWHARRGAAGCDLADCGRVGGGPPPPPTPGFVEVLSSNHGAQHMVLLRRAP